MLGQGIDVEHADFFVVAHIIRLFTVCLSEFEEAAKADVPAVVDVICAISKANPLVHFQVNPIPCGSSHLWKENW